MVLRLALILTGRAHEADDLAQDTLLKAYRAVGRFREGTNVRAWLVTILRNARMDRLRAGRAGGKEVSLEELSAEPADGSRAAVQQWMHPREILEAFSDQQIIDVLKQLPEEIRWTLLLVDVEGLELREAAKVLEVPVGTVKSRTHRGRRMVREVLVAERQSAERRGV